MERILIEGVVEHGRRLGRELGFPTANLAVPELSLIHISEPTRPY